MKELRPCPGEPLVVLAQRLINAAWFEDDGQVRSIFNDIELAVTSETTVQEVVAYYRLRHQERVLEGEKQKIIDDRQLRGRLAEVVIQLEEAKALILDGQPLKAYQHLKDARALIDQVLEVKKVLDYSSSS